MNIVVRVKKWTKRTNPHFACKGDKFLDENGVNWLVIDENYHIDAYRKVGITGELTKSDHDDIDAHQFWVDASSFHLYLDVIRSCQTKVVTSAEEDDMETTIDETGTEHMKRDSSGRPAQTFRQAHPDYAVGVPPPEEDPPGIRLEVHLTTGDVEGHVLGTNFPLWAYVNTFLEKGRAEDKFVTIEHDKDGPIYLYPVMQVVKVVGRTVRCKSLRERLQPTPPVTDTEEAST